MNKLKSLWSRSGMFRFVCYLPPVFGIVLVVCFILIEARVVRHFSTLYLFKGGATAQLIQMFAYAFVLSAMWVWRKPFVIKPLKSTFRWLEEKANED